MKMFKKQMLLLCALLLAMTLVGCSTNNNTEKVEVTPTYSLVQNVYGWGSSYSKVIVPVNYANGKDYVNPADYTVSVERFDTAGNALDKGNRVITAAYRSNAEGKSDDKGSYVCLDLAVTATMPLAQPYYTDPNSYGKTLKAWADCKYTVTNKTTGDTWNELNTVYHPDEAKFASAVFEGDKTIPYAYYEVTDTTEKHPLVVWLHGAGSGGTDIGFVTGGMLVTNFVSDEVQDIFGGAHILLPQSETIWMDDGTGNYAVDGNSGYTSSIIALINKYIEEHDNVDASRVYLGGCSNGGYLTLELARKYPDTFAAIFPICEAMYDVWVSEDDINALKDIPTWFVHCVNDPVVNIQATADATYARLLAAGAKDLHFTRYESINDPDYGNAYGGHFSWIYSLKNLCTTDYDGSPVTVNGNAVTLYEWLASNTK
ncbi:MAG: PHB depolymerase family esterase [Erysipelotrichaceae bacterium]|nr:PHB depolymerase family esterase [Erysipelotrichaceae bacterium]